MTYSSRGGGYYRNFAVGWLIGRRGNHAADTAANGRTALGIALPKRGPSQSHGRALHAHDGELVAITTRGGTVQAAVVVCSIKQQTPPLRSRTGCSEETE